MTALYMLIALGIPAGLIGLLCWFRHREHLRVLEVVDANAERQQPLSVDVIRALPGARVRPANADLRRGVLLIACGAALILIGVCALIGVATTSGEGAVAFGVGIGAIGAIPLCIGVALVFLSRADRTPLA